MYVVGYRHTMYNEISTVKDYKKKNANVARRVNIIGKCLVMKYATFVFFGYFKRK